MNKYPPMKGTWTLVAPDGRKWTADTPLNVLKKEQNERIPVDVRIKRLMAFLHETRMDHK